VHVGADFVGQIAGDLLASGEGGYIDRRRQPNVNVELTGLWQA